LLLKGTRTRHVEDAVGVKCAVAFRRVDRAGRHSLDRIIAAALKRKLQEPETAKYLCTAGGGDRCLEYRLRHLMRSDERSLA
jgi:hypothetical protein